MSEALQDARCLEPPATARVHWRRALHLGIVATKATSNNGETGSALRLGVAPIALAAILAQQPVQAADLESLAARVQILEDREAIRALILATGSPRSSGLPRFLQSLRDPRRMGSAASALRKARKRFSS